MHQRQERVCRGLHFVFNMPSVRHFGSTLVEKYLILHHIQISIDQLSKKCRRRTGVNLTSKLIDIISAGSERMRLRCYVIQKNNLTMHQQRIQLAFPCERQRGHRVWNFPFGRPRRKRWVLDAGYPVFWVWRSVKPTKIREDGLRIYASKQKTVR